MRDIVNHIVFGWYPYLCLTVFLLGSLLRFDREQYTWKTGSSQLLRRRQLMWGSNLFHVGILVIFARPLRRPADADLGLRHARHQPRLQADDGDRVGGIAGIFCLVGITLLTHRRLFDARIRATSSFGDIAILLLLCAQLLLGLATIPVSLGHLDGHEMVKFMDWAQGILMLRADAWTLVADAHPDLQGAPVPGHDDLPGLPVHAAGARVERADLVPRPARLPGGAFQRPPAGAPARRNVQPAE